MRILQVCNKVPVPPKDGGSVAIYNLARGLVLEGNEVDILSMETYKHKDSKDFELPEGLIHESVSIDTTIKKADLIQNFLFSKIPYNAQRFINDEFTHALVYKLSSKHYDIVQLEGLYLTPYIPVIRKHSKAKIALRSHNIENEIWKRLHKHEKSVFKKLYLKSLSNRVERMEKKAINEYDFLVPITYRDAVEYQKMGNSKPSKVIQTGIPSGEITEKIELRKKRKLYFIGSLDWLPNQEGVLWFVQEAWSMIRNTHENIEFHIAGRNAPEWFSKEVKKPGITFHGEVADAKLFAQEFDIMIVPLLSGGGMRVKIVESMSLGKVVVTTSIGAEGLDIIPNYHAVICDQPEEFATGVEILIDNSDFYEKLATNSVRFIKNNYTNRVLARELSNFYQANS